MLVYFILVGGTFAVSLISYELRKRTHFLVEKKNYEVIFFFAFMILMLALRAETVGADTWRYIYLYREIANTPFGDLFANDVELGYRIAEKLLSYILKDPQLYLAFHAVVTITPLAYLYYKEAEMPLLALTMFMALPTFHMAFTGLRQMVAISFIVPAFYAVREKKFLRFLILVALAYMFHQSAFIMLLLYPIYHLPTKRASLVVILPTIIFVYLYNSVLFRWIIRFLPERYFERYNDVWDTGGISVLLMFVAIVILCFFLIRRENLDKDTAGLRNILVLSALLQCFAPINGFAMRVNYYFIVLVPIATARFINRVDDDKRRIAAIAWLGMVVFFLFIFFYKGFNGQDSFKIFPYGTCFSLFS